MSVTREQRTYRAMVTRWGPLAIRRLYRECPECGHVTTYCAERRFCGLDPHGKPGTKAHDVCPTTVCIRCGFVGSTDSGARGRG